jgi:hypothetical protein
MCSFSDVLNNQLFAAIAKISFGVLVSKVINVKYAVSSFTNDAMNLLHFHAQELIVVNDALLVEILTSFNHIHMQVQHFVTIAGLFFMVL